MKTILIPTRFKDDEKQLIAYGSHFSRLLEARLLLYCPIEVFQPHFADGAYVMAEEMAKEFSIEKNNVLRHYAKWLVQLKSFFQESASIELKIDKGIFMQSLINQSIRTMPELILMQGDADGLIDKVSGESNQHLLNKIKSPVCFIPSGIKYQPPMRIALLADYREDQSKSLTGLMALMNNIQASATVFHPKVENEYSFEQEKERFMDKLNLISANSVYHHIDIDGTDIGQSLIQNIKKQQIDMMALVQQHDTSFIDLFSNKITDKLLNELKIPVMVFPEH